jgi:3-demethoxyubiquinol 3-hydroxylase
MKAHMQGIDKIISDFDRALRTVSGIATRSRPNPANKLPEGNLRQDERDLSAGLMRVNHVGEVCAQALYDAQSRFAKKDTIRMQFQHAAQEEEDHLAWTAERLKELGSRPSLLNPLWYGGAYTLGTIAAKIGDAQSLGFVVETERQVEAHLAGHLVRLPETDLKSRAIVEQMRIDEVEHGNRAQEMGASEMPVLVQSIMKAMAKVMTKTAFYI